MDLATVELVARLRLTAWRLGWDVQITVPEDVSDLIGFTGLSDALCVEVERQAEERKEPRGVEEKRQLGDPAA
jgi:hypothetical protein